MLARLPSSPVAPIFRLGRYGRAAAISTVASKRLRQLWDDELITNMEFIWIIQNSPVGVENQRGEIRIPVKVSRQLPKRIAAAHTVCLKNRSDVRRGALLH